MRRTTCLTPEVCLTDRAELAVAKLYYQWLQPDCQPSQSVCNPSCTYDSYAKPEYYADYMGPRHYTLAN